MTIRLSFPRSAAFLRAFIPAALMVIVAAGAVRWRESLDARGAFDEAATQRVALLRSRVRSALDRLRALGAYLDVDGAPDAARFARLTQPLLAGRVPIQALEWIPRVPLAQRDHALSGAGDTGLARLRITARDAQGRLVTEAPRAVAFPVYLLQPLHGNEAALGFDLASNPARRAALLQSMRSGRMTATGRISLVQGHAAQYGFLVFRPVYAGGVVPATPAQRERRLVGFALAVFRIGDLLADAPAAHAPRLAVEVSDDSAPPAQRRLYPRPPTPPARAWHGGTLRLTRPLRVAGRDWMVAVRPAHGAFAPDRGASNAILALGLLAALLWSFYVRQRALHLASIEQAVQQRTRELERQRGFSAAIFEVLGGVGLVLDRDGAIVRFNRAAQQFTGYTQAEVEGRPMFWRNFLPPEERERVGEVFAGFQQADGQADLPQQAENHWVSRNGDRRLFAWTNTTLRDPDGTPRYLVTMGRDITDSRRAQQQIELERLRYRSILQTASDGIHILNADGLLIEANDAFLAMLGHDASAIGRLHVTDWDACSSADELAQRSRSLLAEGRSIVFETCHRRRDGELLDVEISARGIRIGGQPYVYAASRDIRERKRAEAALSASEQRYRQFFEHNTAIKLILDPDDGRIVDANSAAVGFYGYPREQLLAMRIFDINCSGPQDVAQEMARARLDNRLMFQFRHRLADGSVRDVEVYSGPSVADGRTLLYSIVHDVTERQSAVQLRDALLQNTTSGILVARRRVVIAANEAMASMVGIAQADLVGHSARQLYPDAQEFEKVGAAYRELEASGSTSLSNVHIRGAHGRLVPCDLQARLLPDRETAVWTFSDVTGRETQARRMQRAQGVYRALVAATQSLLHSSTESTMISRLCHSLVHGTEFCAVWLARPDAEGLFRMVGRASASREDLSFLDRLHVRTADHGPAIAQAWRDDVTVVYQDNLRRQAHSSYATDMQRLQWGAMLACVVRRGGQPWGVLAYATTEAGWFEDTSRQACEQVAALLGHGLDELDHKAMLSTLQARESRRARTDLLTTLPNRLALGEHLPGALARAQRRGTLVAVGVFDLDDFKPVNDHHGHAAGDELLRQLATALRVRLRRTDFLARLGGDEFVVLFEDVDARQPLLELQVALARLHTAVEQPYDLGGGRRVRVGMTLGLALYPQHGDEADALLRVADTAMYAGKANKLEREHWWRLPDEGHAAMTQATREPEFDALGEEAQALLGALDADMLGGLARGFTEAFYRELARSEDMAKILQGLGEQEFERLRQAQGEHLMFLLSRQTSRPMIEQRAHALGTVHALVGVSGARIEKGFGIYEDRLRAELERAMFSARERYRLLRVTTARLRLDVLTQLDVIDQTVRRYSELLNAPVASGERWMDVLPAIVEQLAALPGMRHAIVFRPDERGFLVDAVGAGVACAELSEALRARDLHPNLNPPPGTDRELVSEAWFTQDLCVADVYACEPSLARWHALARESGWRSAAAIPIVNGDATESVLLLCGAYPMQFSSEWARPWLRALHNRLNAVFAATARGYQPITAARMRRYRELLYGDGLRMWYQPVVDLQSGAVVKVEALARLQPDEHTVHVPAEFLPAFGETQLQTLFVQGLAQALEVLHGWRADGLAIDVSVNLAPSTLLHPDCAMWVERALREARVAAQHLTLEVLENEALDRRRADEAIHALRGLGVHIALDDLGAGYSSLTRLASLPIHTVKIDQALVRELPKAPLRTMRLLGTLLRIGREFAPITVVEGLEEAGHVEAVRLLGADFGQGYGIARPMPAAALPGWVSARSRAAAPGDALQSWAGALAYHWRSVHDRPHPPLHAGAATDCLLGRFFAARGVQDAQALAWHAQCHEPFDAARREAAAQALLEWLVQMVRGPARGLPTDQRAGLSGTG